jgi:hypothetical protein
LSHPVSCDLISHENDAAHHEQGVRHECVLKKSGTRPPHTQANEHRRQRQALANLHSNVEADDIRNETIFESATPAASSPVQNRETVRKSEPRFLCLAETQGIV